LPKKKTRAKAEFKTEIERLTKEKVALEVGLEVAAYILDSWKDSSPVPLESLFSIYATIGNIRSGQDNVSNIQELLPTCIGQFTTRAGLMV
jgi:hypothetical protein